MNNFWARKATLEDVDAITPSTAFRNEPDAKANLRRAFNDESVMFYTILRDEKVLAIVGGHFMYPRVMELWSVADKSVDTHYHYYVKALRTLIHSEFARLGLQRMQIPIRAEEPWAERWIRFLGFKIEGCMKNYGRDNAPYYLASLTEDT